MSSPSRTDPFAEYLPRCWKSALGAEAVDSAESLLDDASHGPAGRWAVLCSAR